MTRRDKEVDNVLKKKLKVLNYQTQWVAKEEQAIIKKT